MRFPSLKSRKSSSSNGAPSTSPPNSSSTAGGAALEPVSSNGNSNTGSTSSLLSRWKSNVDEHGVLIARDGVPSSNAPPASASTTANTGKRSFFSRKSHTRSVSSGAQEVLDSSIIDTSGHSRSATISNAHAAVGGGHPLRQNTLPADLDTTPQKAKRPGLSFPKRGFTVADASSTSHHNNSNDASALRKSFTSSSYHASSPTSHTFDSTETRPLSRTQDSPASRSSDSFQLKSFRSVTGVREEPTLSSLVDAELTHSPLSTRPSSPATAPASSTSSTSYFDSRLGGSTSSGSRTPTHSNASISVSRFREAKAVRSSSSLNSNASQATAQRQSSGLKLDLPPPISLEYPSRPVLNIVQPDSRSPPPSRPATPANKFATATSESLSRASSASPSRESYSTAYNALHASPPRMASPTSPQRSISSSINSHEDRQPAMHPLAAHPDNALPLPPLPVDPAQQQRQHRRTVSNQSVSSLSASLGGWLNSTTTTFGLSFSAEDVQKALVEKAAALRSRSPTMKDGFSFGSNTHDRSMSQQQVQEEEVIMSPAQLGPTREELAILLGGKVLPPPPSETGDDYDPRSPVQASPKIPLSRASSYSNLGFGTNLFASTFSKAAKPARDDDDDESDNSRDVSLVKASQARPITGKRASRASNAFDTSDTSSDEAASDIEEEDSDDSEARAKKKERSLVFPPPRPMNEADRQRIYQAALTPPTLTPQGSSSDLKAFVQPVPPTAPLTSANIKALINDEDDDEDVPLSTIKIRAQSEIGLASPHLRPSASARGLQVPFGGSTIGLPSRSPSDEQRGRIREKHSGTSPLAVPSPTSVAMPRSLSAFNTAVSGPGASSQPMQARSASSYAISSFASTSALPRHVSLSSLIELEAKNADGRLPILQKQASTASSKPSNSSDGSYPPSPSDTTASVNKRASKSTLFPPTHLSPIRSQKSQLREHKATASVEDARRIHPSSPISKIDSPKKAKAGDRRSLAYGNGSLATASANNVANPNQGFAASYGMPMSPQALQGMPAPPGVDPALYASLPPDQKLDLQMRAQQLLSVMQGMTLQAQNGTLGAPPQFPSHTLPSSPYGFLPMQMQMPMMGSTVPAFPPFPNFFGMPAGFPNHMPPFCSNMNNMHSHQNFAAPSAIGQPTLLQQAGLSTQGTNTLSVPSQHHRRKSQ